MKKAWILVALAIVACATQQPQAASAPTPRTDLPPWWVGDFWPPNSDSIMKSGPYAGAVAVLTCNKGLMPIVGDVVPCTVSTTVMGPRGPVTTELEPTERMHPAFSGIFDPVGKDKLVARAPGRTTIWTNVYGAFPRAYLVVTPRYGSIKFEPDVPDTLIRIGDTLKLRLLFVDEAGRTAPLAHFVYSFDERPVGRQIGFFQPVDSIQRRFVPTSAGRTSITATYGQRNARMFIRVDSAAKRDTTTRRVIATGPFVRVTVTRDGTRVPHVGLTLGPDSSVSFTDSTGTFRFTRVKLGTHTIQLTCPVSRRLVGREFARQVVHVEPATDTAVHVVLNPNECVEPPNQTIRGVFAGHYTRAFDEETFQPCKAFPPGGGDAYDLSDQRALVALEDSVAKDPRLTRLYRAGVDSATRMYVRWSGTLTGPASYGIRGRENYLLHVEQIAEARRPSATDCK